MPSANWQVTDRPAAGHQNGFSDVGLKARCLKAYQNLIKFLFIPKAHADEVDCPTNETSRIWGQLLNSSEARRFEVLRRVAWRDPALKKSYAAQQFLGWHGVFAPFGILLNELMVN